MVSSEQPTEEKDRRWIYILLFLLLLLLLMYYGREQLQMRAAKKEPVVKTSLVRVSKPLCRKKTIEVCDGLDNDCDGHVDEGFQLTCRLCPDGSCVEAELVGGAWLKGRARNLLIGNDHGIALPPHPKRNPYIYIANSLPGTVSKLRIKDGVEVGRFYVGVNPSRTAVDGNGDAWIAMRGRTSDRTGAVLENIVKLDGRCIPKVKPPNVTRECILLDIPDVSNVLRGIAVDATGDVWAGAYMKHELVRMDGRTGLVKKRIRLPGDFSPYGVAVDERGYIWVASRTGSLVAVRVDPLSNRVDLKIPLKQTKHTRPYGLAADGKGGIWFGSNAPYVFLLDAVTGKLRKHIVVGKQTRGVAVDERGWLWVADSRLNAVLKVSQEDGSVKGSFPVGKSPVGVAVDHAGDIWAVNLQSHDATKLTVDGTLRGTFPVGKSPYTYGDMTGAAYRVFHTLRGVFRGRYNVGVKGAMWRSLRWKGMLSKYAKIVMKARAADASRALSQRPWTDVSIRSRQATLSLKGAWLEIEVSLVTKQRTTPSLLDAITFQFSPAQ